MARLTGSNRDDVFTVNVSNLNSLQLRAGRGYDTLRVTGSNSSNISSTVTSQWRELEAIDLSGFYGQLSLSISSTLISGSATGTFDITTSATSSLTLSAVFNGVKLFGNGIVQLSNMTNNIVEIASANVLVNGGNLNDTITASAFGNVLDGGQGDDILIAGVGVDLILHNATEGADTVENFNVTVDKIDLSGHGEISFYDLKKMISQSAEGSTIVFSDGGQLFLKGVVATELTRENFIQNQLPIEEYGALIKVYAGITAAEVNAIIATVPDGTTIMFMDGDYTFDQSLLVNRDNVTLVGQSQQGTRLTFDVDAIGNAPFIAISGGEKVYRSVTTANAVATSTVIEVSQTTELSVGDVIYIYQPNTAEYLLANGWTNVSMAEAESRPFREFITTIVAINGSQVTLSNGLPFDFDANETRIFEMDVVSGVSLQSLTITSTLGPANAYSFTNTLPLFDNHVAISVNSSSGFSLSNLSLLNSPSTGLALTATINATVNNLEVIGAHNKGGDGNGYGVLLSESFHNTLTDLTLLDGRHSVVFSAWNSESSNLIDVTLTNRDINFHGGPDNANTVNVQRGVMSYDLNIDPSQWSIVSGGATNHAATDIWGDNNITFEFAVGSSAVDYIVGSDTGSYLNGLGSNDTLQGGNGSDVIVGGLRRDLMTGGGGQDMFVLKLGDDLDQITDFQFGIGGDLLVFTGNTLVDGNEDLVFTQDGSHLRIRYGSNSTVILSNTQLSEIDQSNFVFDPSGANYDAVWAGLL